MLGNDRGQCWRLVEALVEKYIILTPDELAEWEVGGPVIPVRGLCAGLGTCSLHQPAWPCVCNSPAGANRPSTPSMRCLALRVESMTEASCCWLHPLAAPGWLQLHWRTPRSNPLG